MPIEVIELTGPGVCGARNVLRAKLREYRGVLAVRATGKRGRLKLVVEYDDTASGGFDASARFILERAGCRNVTATVKPEGGTRKAE